METQDQLNYLQELAWKTEQGTITPEEKTFFDNWYNSHRDDLLMLPANYGPDAGLIRDRIYLAITSRMLADGK